MAAYLTILQIDATLTINYYWLLLFALVWCELFYIQHICCQIVQYSERVAECTFNTIFHAHERWYFELMAFNKTISLFVECALKQKHDPDKRSHVHYSEPELQLCTYDLRVTLVNYFTALQNDPHTLSKFLIYANSESGHFLVAY